MLSLIAPKVFLNPCKFVIFYESAIFNLGVVLIVFVYVHEVEVSLLYSRGSLPTSVFLCITSFRSTVLSIRLYIIYGLGE